MPHLLIFGQGYTGTRLRTTLEREGWTVSGTDRMARPGLVAADDPGLAEIIAAATHVVSAVPPGETTDPILERHGSALAACGAKLAYISSAGVYGDTGGAWVDETAPVGGGRRSARTAADLGWQALGARVLRLPGLYGPGRSALDRVRAGTAHRTDAGDQVFGRVHVDDVVAAIIAAFDAGPGVWNIADDMPTPGHVLTAFACRLLGITPPPLLPLADAVLSANMRAFYAENRRVANGKMKRDLGIRLRYPDYRSGLRACLREECP